MTTMRRAGPLVSRETKNVVRARPGLLACREMAWLRDVPASCPCPVWRWDGRVMKWHRDGDHYWFCPWGGRP